MTLFDARTDDQIFGRSTRTKPATTAKPKGQKDYGPRPNRPSGWAKPDPIKNWVRNTIPVGPTDVEEGLTARLRLPVGAIEVWKVSLDPDEPTICGNLRGVPFSIRSEPGADIRDTLNRLTTKLQELLA